MCACALGLIPYDASTLRVATGPPYATTTTTTYFFSHPRLLGRLLGPVGALVAAFSRLSHFILLLKARSMSGGVVIEHKKGEVNELKTQVFAASRRPAAAHVCNDC